MTAERRIPAAPEELSEVGFTPDSVNKNSYTLFIKAASTFKQYTEKDRWEIMIKGV